MDSLSRRLLGAAALGQLGVGILHFVIPFLGPDAWAAFGAPELTTLARTGSRLPALLTFALAIGFSGFGALALAAAAGARMRRWTRAVLIGVGAVYALRGGIAVAEVPAVLHGHAHAARGLGFSLVALTIGVLQLGGLFSRRRS